MTIHWKAVEQYCGAVCLFVNFTQFETMENLSVLDSALSEVKGLNNHFRSANFLQLNPSTSEIHI